MTRQTHVLANLFRFEKACLLQKGLHVGKPKLAFDAGTPGNRLDPFCPVKTRRHCAIAGSQARRDKAYILSPDRRENPARNSCTDTFS